MSANNSTPEELAAALALAESKSWLTDEKCFAALDTLDHMVPRNSDDALEVHEEVNGILASAYRAQAVEMERLRHENTLLVDHGPQATIAELQSQLAREKARAEELQLCLGATEAQVRSLKDSIAELQRERDELLRARQHVPANAVDAKAALTRPREECRTLTEIDAVLAELRRVKEDI